MFHRIIFILLFITSLSCNFSRCADCFQSVSEQRFPEYSKCRALNRFKIENNHNKILYYIVASMFIQTLASASMLALQKTEPAARIDDFENFFNGLWLKPTRASIVLNIEW